jgi:hypothetical protein
MEGAREVHCRESNLQTESSRVRTRARLPSRLVSEDTALLVHHSVTPPPLPFAPRRRTTALLDDASGEGVGDVGCVCAHHVATHRAAFAQTLRSTCSRVWQRPTGDTCFEVKSVERMLPSLYVRCTQTKCPQHLQPRK